MVFYGLCSQTFKSKSLSKAKWLRYNVETWRYSDKYIWSNLLKKSLKNKSVNYQKIVLQVSIMKHANFSCTKISPHPEMPRMVPQLQNTVKFEKITLDSSSFRILWQISALLRLAKILATELIFVWLFLVKTDQSLKLDSHSRET